jgi:hypothetical protein
LPTRMSRVRISSPAPISKKAFRPSEGLFY